jgi:hypothetical protein
MKGYNTFAPQVLEPQQHLIDDFVGVEVGALFLLRVLKQISLFAVLLHHVAMTSSSKLHKALNLEGFLCPHDMRVIQKG